MLCADLSFYYFSYFWCGCGYCICHKSSVKCCLPLLPYTLYLFNMDFCKNESIVKLFSKTNNSGSVYFELLYKIYCPCIIFAGLVSILLNGILMTVRSNRRLRTSPMLILSLNLALTDEIASILTVIVIIYNSYLPVVFGLSNNNCFSITIEVFRISSLVASVFHLLALTWLHYSAITNPLHHR